MELKSDPDQCQIGDHILASTLDDFDPLNGVVEFLPGRPRSVLDVNCDDGATKPAATEKWVFMFAEWRNPDGDIVKVWVRDK
ncbi:MAG: hypothetical protein V4819_11230 [Verrucomicrobiota bacterium]